MQNEILDLPYDEPQEEEELDLADGGRRFANYLIDRILSQVLAGGIIVLFESAPKAFEEEAPNEIMGLVMIYLIIFGYYTVMEGAFNGKTLGKFITRTRAVREDGTSLDWEKAALRSVCRLIPFDALSFMFVDVGWHDKLSKTRVVNDRKRS